MAYLTESGLHITAAITVSVFAHSEQYQVWSGPRGCAAFQHTPGPLPAITMEAGELRYAADPLLLDHKGEPGPRWFGSYSRGWFDVEGMTVDFADATFGARVVWREDYLPAPVFICGGSHDWNFDSVEDAADIADFQMALAQGDERADWDENGVTDFFDFLGFMEGW